ncbi:hypothetical protein [Streptomyces sp. NPDC059010]|uniref:hypothetical protein n=1 Tax=Streptomyces sp. NPDC059010 TaxID=3346695 RepID=UPI00369C058B
MQARQTPPAAPAWARNLSEPRLLAAGEDWDAIRVEADVGVRAVRLLEAVGTPVGPVLHDLCSDRTYFLTPPGTADGWREQGARALGAGSWVVLPPPAWDGLLRWVIEPTEGIEHTAIDDLAPALERASMAETECGEPGE